MMVTHLITGKWPEEITLKRELRIKEALSYPVGSFEDKTYNMVCEAGNLKAYFLKPGKEYFWDGDKRNINDMTPCVGTDRNENIYKNYAFSDIWSDLLKLSFALSEDSYKQLYVLIYRLAFFLDCEIVGDKVRFAPSDEVKAIITHIQDEADNCAVKCNVTHLLMFLDLVAWNEDVKYQVSKVKAGEKAPRNQGRINNLLSMISIPLILRDFVTNVLEEKDNPENIDFSAVIEIAQQFARTRGVSPISNSNLIERLSPYLVE